MPFLCDEPGRDALDVTALAREYMEELGAVRDELRAALIVDLNYCKTRIRSAIEQYAAEIDGNVAGLAAAKFSSDNTAVDY